MFWLDLGAITCQLAAWHFVARTHAPIHAPQHPPKPTWQTNNSRRCASCLLRILPRREVLTCQASQPSLRICRSLKRGVWMRVGSYSCRQHRQRTAARRPPTQTEDNRRPPTADRRPSSLVSIRRVVWGLTAGAPGPWADRLPAARATPSPFLSPAVGA